MPIRNLKTLDSFRSAAFRFYFFGMMGQWAAMTMLTIIQSLLVFRLTGSTIKTGTIALGTALPGIALFMVGGTMADRLNKKTLIQVGQLASGLMMLAVAVAIHTGYMTEAHPESWWVLLGTAVVQGIFMALTVPARQAIIPELVSQDRIMNAMALNQMGVNVFRLIAPAAGGFMVDAVGFAAVFYLMAGLYGAAVVLTAFIPSAAKAVPKDRNTWAEAGEGLVYIWKRPVIFFILLYAIFYIVLFMPYQTMLPVFTDTIMKVNATKLGILQTASGLGALIASLILATLNIKKSGWLVLVGGFASGLGVVGLAFSHSWVLSLGAMAVIGAGSSAHGTALVTSLQQLSDADYLGRVMSILLVNQGLSGLGTFFVGILSSSIGVQWGIGGFALALMFLSLVFLVATPRVRRA